MKRYGIHSGEPASQRIEPQQWQSGWSSGKRTGHATLTIVLEIAVVAVLIWLGFAGFRSMLLPDQAGSTPECASADRQIMRMAVTSAGNQMWCQLGMSEIVALDLTTHQLKSVYRRRHDAIGNWGVSYNGRTALLSNKDNELEIIRDEVVIISEHLPDCARLLTELSSSGMAAIRIADGTAARCWQLEDDNSMVVDFTLQEVAGKIALDASGHCLAVTTLSNGIHIYHVKEGVKSRSIDDDDRRHVKSLSLCDDGKSLAVVRGATVFVYDVESGDRLWMREIAGSVPFVSLSFSRDGKRLAISSSNSGIQIKETATGKTEAEIAVESTLMRVAFSESNDVIYSGSSSGLIRAWSISGGDEIERTDLLDLYDTFRKKK